MKYNFEWNAEKAKSNLKKHGVSFEEASEVFLDSLQISIPDKEHNEIEERWITLGNTRSNKLRLVVHTYLTYYDKQVTIRLISARPATKHEQRQYEGE